MKDRFVTIFAAWSTGANGPTPDNQHHRWKRLLLGRSRHSVVIKDGTRERNLNVRFLKS